MRKQTIDPGRICPICGRKENQINAGFNRSGTRRCVCKFCNYKYTLSPKTREIPKETREQAIKMFLAGVSARKVGQLFGFSKENVLNWIKKNTAK
jgi:transposase-like protein